MKKLFLLIILAISVNANAQIKNVAYIVDLSKKTFNQVAAIMEKSYWKKYEDGKMDTLNYTRWIPAVPNDKNVGDNVMCFYRRKDKRIEYIVLQTINAPFRDQCRAEVKKSGYMELQNEKKKGEIKESYQKNNCNVTIFEGKQTPTDAVSYLIGAKMIR
jgi:hypothetical protein